MKKSYFLFGILSIFLSCSELEEPQDYQSILPNATTRFTGDGKYDVLGFGYDVTGEYLHPKSVKNPVLDIAKYDRDFNGQRI